MPVKAYHVKDSRSFEIKVKAYGEYGCLLKRTCNCTSDRYVKFDVLKRYIQSEYGLLSQYQKFMVYKDGRYVNAKATNSSNSQLECFEQNGGAENDCLTLYLTSRFGYRGKRNTFTMLVKVKPFGPRDHHEFLLENELVYNTIFECERFFQIIKTKLMQQTDIPTYSQILLDHESKPFNAEEYIKSSLSSSNASLSNHLDGEIILHLSVNAKLMDKRIEKICEKYKIVYLKNIFLKTLTNTEKISVSDVRSIDDVREYVSKSQKIPKQALQYMVNSVEVSDDELLLDLFYKQSGNQLTYSLTIFTLVRIFNVSVSTLPDHVFTANIKVSELDTITEVKEKITNRSINLLTAKYIGVYKDNVMFLDAGKTVVQCGLKDGDVLTVKKVLRIAIYENEKRLRDCFEVSIHDRWAFQDLLLFIKRTKRYRENTLRLRELDPKGQDVTHETMLFYTDKLIFDFRSLFSRFLKAM